MIRVTVLAFLLPMAVSATAQIVVSKAVVAGNTLELDLQFGEHRCNKGTALNQLCSTDSDCPGGKCIRNPFTPTTLSHRWDVVSPLGSGVSGTGAVQATTPDPAPTSDWVQLIFPASMVYPRGTSNPEQQKISLRWTYPGGDGVADVQFPVQRLQYQIPAPTPTP